MGRHLDRGRSAECRPHESLVMRSYHRLLIGSTLWKRIRVVLLGALVLTILATGLWWIQDEFRGGASPEEVAARYIDAMKRGDEFAVLWLMHPSYEQRGPVAERIERYRRIGAEQAAFELVPQSEASYLVGVRIKVQEGSFDDIVIENKGTGPRSSRWFLVAFHKTGFLPAPSPSVAPTGAVSIGPTPINFVLPANCTFVGQPAVGPERTEWRYDCGPEQNRDARGALRDALTAQGWTSCGPVTASETWLKDGLALTISESSGSPGDYPRFSQRHASGC